MFQEVTQGYPSLQAGQSCTQFHSLFEQLTRTLHVLIRAIPSQTSAIPAESQKSQLESQKCLKRTFLAVLRSSFRAKIHDGAVANQKSAEHKYMSISTFLNSSLDNGIQCTDFIIIYTEFTNFECS